MISLEFATSSVLTLFCLWLAYKKLHSSYATFLWPERIVLDDYKSWIIIIKNSGQAVAKDIKLKTFIAKFIPDQVNKRAGLIYVVRMFKPANGPFVIESLKDGEFSFKFGTIDFKSPFYLKWKSIHNKKYKNIWIAEKKENEYNFRELRLLELTIYRFQFFLKFLPNIFKKARRCYRTRSVKTNDDLITIDKKNDIINMQSRAVELFKEDRWGKLKVFTTHLVKKYSENTAISFIIKSVSLREYIKEVTGNKPNIIDSKGLSIIEQVESELGIKLNPHAEWHNVQSYDGSYEGLISFGVKPDNQIVINKTGLEILNSYYDAFKKKISQ